MAHDLLYMVKLYTFLGNETVLYLQGDFAPNKIVRVGFPKEIICLDDIAKDRIFLGNHSKGKNRRE